MRIISLASFVRKLFGKAFFAWWPFWPYLKPGAIHIFFLMKEAFDFSQCHLIEKPHNWPDLFWLFVVKTLGTFKRPPPPQVKSGNGIDDYVVNQPFEAHASQSFPVLDRMCFGCIQGPSLPWIMQDLLLFFCPRSRTDDTAFPLTVETIMLHLAIACRRF